jgi:hypothetical protein
MATISNTDNSTNMDAGMNIPDRIIERPPVGATPARWFFKTSEGLMGPFESLDAAQAMLQSFVARCQAGDRTDQPGNH